MGKRHIHNTTAPEKYRRKKQREHDGTWKQQNIAQQLEMTMFF